MRTGRRTADNRRQRTFKSKLLKGSFVLLWSMVCSQWSFSQDIHFTQFFSNPLILNPAHTGLYDGNYRVGFNFKAQWPWAISNTTYNYHTETPYVDLSFGEKQIRVGWMGIGFNFLNDQAGDGRLTYRRFTLSYAYHQAFDEDHNYILSAGVVVSSVIRSVDFSKFYFNNQWLEEEGFDISLNSGEASNTKQSFTYFDIGFGLNFVGQVNGQLKLKAGYSMLHLNRPKHTFYDKGERLGLRYQGNAGVEYQFNDTWSGTIDGYYTYEKKASAIVVGARVGYSFQDHNSYDPEHTIYLGVYYRIKDALAPLVGYRWRKTQLLLSYDVTLSKLIVPGRANGGPEISLVHYGGWGMSRFDGTKIHCPRF